MRQVTALLHRLLPDLESFNLTIEAVHGLPIAASDVGCRSLRRGLRTTILLVVAVAIFERRDFK